MGIFLGERGGGGRGVVDVVFVTVIGFCVAGGWGFWLCE